MRQIYKYEVDPHGEFYVSLPENAEFLHVGLDLAGKAYMWWMVDDKKQKVNFGFRVAFTGEEYGDKVDRYLGPFIVDYLVCHLFHRV